jgi:hypothetical protein
MVAMEYLGRTDIVQVPPTPEEARGGRGPAVADDEDSEIAEAHVAAKSAPAARPAKAASEAAPAGAVVATASADDKETKESRETKETAGAATGVAPLVGGRRPIGFNVGALSKEGKEALESDLPGLLPADGVPAHPERNQAGSAAKGSATTDGDGGAAHHGAPANSAVTIDAAQRAAEQKLLASMMGDAPPCSECGSLMRRNGACYVCPNCGSGGGCG